MLLPSTPHDMYGGVTGVSNPGYFLLAVGFTSSLLFLLLGGTRGPGYRRLNKTAPVLGCSILEDRGAGRPDKVTMSLVEGKMTCGVVGLSADGSPRYCLSCESSDRDRQGDLGGLEWTIWLAGNSISGT